jgi:hypothetical protein
VTAVWVEIDRELTPIIGVRGVAALHGRSLFLASRQHPWLRDANGAQHGVQLAMDLEALERCISAQSSDAARAGSAELLQTFDDLLASMVGPALSERLLRRLADAPASGDAAPRDTTT